jgi:hypothetical protein
MAINRFDQFLPLDLSMTRYEPEAYVPDVAMIGKVQDTLQQSYDQLSAPYKLPKYISQSSEDVEAFRKYRRDLEAKKSEAKSNFLTGNVGKAMKSMRDLENYINDENQPGGIFYGLEARYDQYNKIKDQIRKDWKDHPFEANYAISTIDFGKFRDPVTDEISSIQDPFRPRLLKEEELNKQIVDQANSIKDTLIGQGKLGPMAAPHFNTIMDIYELEGVTFNRVVDALASMYEPTGDVMMSEAYKAKARGQDFEPSFFLLEKNDQGEWFRKRDADGRLMLNPKNSVANKIMGAAIGAERQKKVHKWFQFEDKEGWYKRKLELDNKDSVETMVGQLSQTGEKIPFNISVGDGGLYDEITDEGFAVSSATGSKSYSLTTKKKIGSSEDLVQNALTGKLDKTYPGLSRVLSPVKTELRDLEALGNYEAAHGLMKRMWDESETLRTQSDYKFEQRSDTENGKKAFISDQRTWVDAGKFMNHPYFYMMTSEDGAIKSGQLTYQDLLDKTGLKPEDLRENLVMTGRLASANNPIAPSGNTYRLGELTIFGAHESLQKSRQREALHMLFNVRNAKDMDISQPVMPNVYNAEGEHIREAFPNGIYSKKIYRTNRDVMLNSAEQYRDRAMTYREQLPSIKDLEQKSRMLEAINNLETQAEETEAKANSIPLKDLHMQELDIELYDGLYHPDRNNGIEKKIPNNEMFKEKLLQQTEKQY